MQKSSLSNRQRMYDIAQFENKTMCSRVYIYFRVCTIENVSTYVKDVLASGVNIFSKRDIDGKI